MREQSLRPLEECHRQDTGAIPGAPLRLSRQHLLLCAVRDFEIERGETVLLKMQKTHHLEQSRIFDQLGSITTETSQRAGEMLMRLEGIE